MEGKITIIGTGRVARHLTKALTLSGHATDMVNSRTLEALPMHNGLYVIAVSDTAIESVSRRLGNIDAIVVHTSGATPAEVLSAHRRHGVLYPCQTFTAEDEIEYSDVHFAVEGSDSEVTKRLTEVARLISDNVHVLDSEQRTHLHIASVICNNFVNHLLTLSHDYMRSHNLPYEMLQPLALQTVRKAFNIPPAQAQTGPAARADMQTIERHLRTITDPRLNDIYRHLTNSILSQKKTDNHR